MKLVVCFPGCIFCG